MIHAVQDSHLVDVVATVSYTRQPSPLGLGLIDKI